MLRGPDGSSASGALTRFTFTRGSSGSLSTIAAPPLASVDVQSRSDRLPQIRARPHFHHHHPNPSPTASVRDMAAAAQVCAAQSLSVFFLRTTLWTLKFDLKPFSMLLQVAYLKSLLSGFHSVGSRSQVRQHGARGSFRSTVNCHKYSLLALQDAS